MKNIIKYTWIICLLFVLSCDDKTTQEFGSLQINLETESGKVDNSARSSNQLNDYNVARITINGTADTISLNGSSASYSKSGIPVGTATISVELLNISDVRYSSSTSVQIQADDVSSVSLNNWSVENQQITFTQSMDQSYDQGDTISFYWDNTHSEQSVSLYYMTLNGNVWEVYSTLTTDFTGNSAGFDSSDLPAGLGKIRIESDISSAYVESSIFQLNAQSNANIENLTYNDLQWYNSSSYIISWDKMRLTWDYADNTAQTEYDTFICDANDTCLLADTATANVNSNGQLEKIIDLNWIEYIQGDWNGTNPRRMKVCLSDTDNCSTSAEFNMYYYLATGQWTIGNSPSLSQGQSIFLGHLSTAINSLSITTSGGNGDIDVFIYKVENPLTSSATYTIVASGETNGNSENVSVNTTGYYFVQIYGYSASSNYGMNFTYTRSSDGKVFTYSNEEEIQKP